MRRPDGCRPCGRSPRSPHSRAARAPPAGALPAGSDAAAALRAFSTDAEAAAALAPLAATRVLEIAGDPTAAFCRFADAAAQARFRAALEAALRADVWFCAPVPQPPGGAKGGPRRNCTVGFPVPAALPAGADCAQLAREGRDWRDAFGDALLGTNRLV